MRRCPLILNKNDTYIYLISSIYMIQMRNVYLISGFPHMLSFNADTLTCDDTSTSTFTYADNTLTRDSDGAMLYYDPQHGLSFSTCEKSVVTFESTAVRTNVYIKVHDAYLIHDHRTIRVSPTPTEWICMPSIRYDNFQFVIARYNENVQWTRYLPGRVIIYNKGKHDLFFPQENITIVPLENIGREGHTYLHHIITHYHQLADKTFFLQGHPFDHSEQLLELICMHAEYAPLQSLSGYYIKDKIPSKEVFDRYKRSLGGAYYAVYPITQDLSIVDYFDAPLFTGTIYVYKMKHSCAGIIPHFMERCKLNVPRRDVYSFIFAGLFAVNRDRILHHPVSQYETIKKELLRYNCHGGREGYVLERLWHTLFE